VKKKEIAKKLRGIGIAIEGLLAEMTKPEPEPVPAHALERGDRVRHRRSGEEFDIRKVESTHFGYFLTLVGDDGTILETWHSQVTLLQSARDRDIQPGDTFTCSGHDDKFIAHDPGTGGNAVFDGNVFHMRENCTFRARPKQELKPVRPAPADG